jgi:hypothetical protein
MKRQYPFNLFNGNNQVREMVYYVGLSLVMLVAVGLTACMAVLPEEELEAAGEREAVTESTFYAANPELMAADRSTAIVDDEAKAGSGFYAVNPELMVASRHTTAVKADRASPAADPLQRIVRCCYGTEKWTATSSFQAANPELMVVGRYQNVGEGETGTDLAFYAANPELMIADRYAVALEEELRHQRILFPGR